MNNKIMNGNLCKKKSALRTLGANFLAMVTLWTLCFTLLTTPSYAKETSSKLAKIKLSGECKITFPPLKVECKIVFGGGKATLSGIMKINEREEILIISNPKLKNKREKSFTLTEEIRFDSETAQALGYKEIVLIPGTYEVSDNAIKIKMKLGEKVSCNILDSTSDR